MKLNENELKAQLKEILKNMTDSVERSSSILFTDDVTQLRKLYYRSVESEKIDSSISKNLRSIVKSSLCANEDLILLVLELFINTL